MFVQTHHTCAVLAHAYDHLTIHICSLMMVQWTSEALVFFAIADPICTAIHTLPGTGGNTILRINFATLCNVTCFPAWSCTGFLLLQDAFVQARIPTAVARSNPAATCPNHRTLS